MNVPFKGPVFKNKSYYGVEFNSFVCKTYLLLKEQFDMQISLHQLKGAHDCGVDRRNIYNFHIAESNLAITIYIHRYKTYYKRNLNSNFTCHI